MHGTLVGAHRVRPPVMPRPLLRRGGGRTFGCTPATARHTPHQTTTPSPWDLTPGGEGVSLVGDEAPVYRDVRCASSDSGWAAGAGAGAAGAGVPCAGCGASAGGRLYAACCNWRSSEAFICARMASGR